MGSAAPTVAATLWSLYQNIPTPNLQVYAACHRRGRKKREAGTHPLSSSSQGSHPAGEKREKGQKTTVIINHITASTTRQKEVFI